MTDAMVSFHSMVDLESLAPERIRPIRRVEYDRMVELGLFEDERVELLAGVLVEMSPQGVPHSYAIRELTELFVLGLRGRAKVGPQLPFALDDDSEPEPDLAITPAPDNAREHPSRAYLIVEVADSSLRKDRRIKAALYAAAGVEEYWVVNLVDGVVEVHRQPGAGGYESITVAGRGETVSPLRFPDLAIHVDAILPG